MCCYVFYTPQLPKTVLIEKLCGLMQVNSVCHFEDRGSEDIIEMVLEDICFGDVSLLNDFRIQIYVEVTE
jgi:hypothetical protein